MTEDVLKPLNVSFTNNPQEELSIIAKEMQIFNLARILEKVEGEIPEELANAVAGLAQVVEDLFLSPIPVLDEDPATNLRKVSRDINLARILRERGLFRFYLLAKTKTDVHLDLPSGATQISKVNTFQTLLNPDRDNSPFQTLEEFIKWFTTHANVSRPLVFLRLATYKKYVNTLGYTPQEAFKIISTKPDFLRKKLEEVAEWDSTTAELLEVPPYIAINMAELVQIGEDRDYTVSLANEVISLTKENAPPEEIQAKVEELNEACIPIIRSLMEELAAHDSIRDAGRLFDVAVMNKPQIKYLWDSMLGGLKIVMYNRSLDEDGQEVLEGRYSVELLPNSFEELPEPIIKDLVAKTGATSLNLDANQDL